MQLLHSGLGQFVQGRVLMALVQVVLAGVIWFISFGTLGWVVHIWSVIDAALWKGPRGVSGPFALSPQ